jgi:integrase/recombinase XerD
MSALREALRDYLELRRSLGYKLQDAGLQLPRFIDFLETRGASHITTALAMEWAQQPTAVQPAEWARRLGGVRGLARYRHASDPLTEIPSPGPAAFTGPRGLYAVSCGTRQSHLTAAAALNG